VDQYLLASMGAGCCDSTLANDRSVLFEFIRFLGRPLWTALASDADRFLAHQRKELGRSHSTVHKKALALGSFFDFLVARHQGDIRVLTGHVVGQVIDEFNRPASSDYGSAPVPPGALRRRASASGSLVIMERGLAGRGVRRARRRLGRGCGSCSGPDAGTMAGSLGRCRTRMAARSGWR
jgi:hypothetical protein